MPSMSIGAEVLDRVSPKAITEPGKFVGRLYRPELDVLRFLAFLMVYVGHTLFINSNASPWLKATKDFSRFGVTLFFGLSAYLVTELLTMEKRASGSVKVGYFYNRRILRIWPLYFVVLGFGYLLSRLYGPVIPVSAMLAYILLVGNWYTTRFDFLPNAVGVLWSISVEEQFYLTWPLVVQRASKRTLMIVCGVAWLVSQASLLFLCSRHALINPAVWTNSLVQLQYFAVGAGLSLFLRGSVPKISGLARVSMLFAALMLYFGSELIFDNYDERASIAHTFPIYLCRGAAVLLILTGMLGCSSLERWRGVRLLGKISYGLYVYHAFALMFITNVAHAMGYQSETIISLAGLGLTIAVAWISYEYFERPFIRLKERFAIVQSRPA